MFCTLVIYNYISSFKTTVHFCLVKGLFLLFFLENKYDWALHSLAYLLLNSFILSDWKSIDDVV